MLEHLKKKKPLGCNGNVSNNMFFLNEGMQGYIYKQNYFYQNAKSTQNIFCLELRLINNCIIISAVKINAGAELGFWTPHSQLKATQTEAIRVHSFTLFLEKLIFLYIIVRYSLCNQNTNNKQRNKTKTLFT